MTSKSLRTLAKEYASGMISKDDYRSARNELLEGIVKGEVIVKAIDFRPPLKNQDLDTTQEKTTIRPAEVENDILRFDKFMFPPRLLIRNPGESPDHHIYSYR